jgi:hypothetical protein
MKKRDKITNSVEHNIKDVSSFTQNIDIKYSENDYTTNTSEFYKTRKKREISYAINLDWLQIVCLNSSKKDFNNYKDKNILIRKNKTNHNPNFNYSYSIIVNNEEIIELHSSPRNNYIYNEFDVLLRVQNKVLYDCEWMQILSDILNALSLEFLKITRLDIALDSEDLINQMSIFWRSIKTNTVVKGNKSLKINGIDHREGESKFSSYTVGTPKSSKYASLYNKSEEILKSEKIYIKDFWVLNGLNISHDIGRFELRLTNKFIKKYIINSISDLTAGLLSEILRKEVTDWLKFYRVKLKDIKRLRKDIALQKSGKEIEFIKWQYLPKSTIGLNHSDYTGKPIFNAKRSITFSINELSKFDGVYNTHNTNVQFIENIMDNYGLYSFTLSKVDEVIKRLNEPETNPLYGYLLELKQRNFNIPD